MHIDVGVKPTLLQHEQSTKSVNPKNNLRSCSIRTDFKPVYQSIGLFSHQISPSLLLRATLAQPGGPATVL